MKKIMMALVLLAGVATTKVSNAQSYDPNMPCYEEGLMGASSVYCSNFFICSNGVWVRFICPSGLEYNEMTETCDFPFMITHYCGCYLP